MNGTSCSIHKFGGGCLKSAEGYMAMARIVSSLEGNVVIVVSALGSTTNMLEAILHNYLSVKPSSTERLDALKATHFEVISNLAGEKANATRALEDIFRTIEQVLSIEPSTDYNYIYDQLIPYGEILSSTIASAFLTEAGIPNTHIFAPNVLRTDSKHREANILFDQSARLCSTTFYFSQCKVFITQGFIAGADQGKLTTLGREGSDYSAAVFASILSAASLSIWKDVDGVLNADPKIFPNTQVIPRLSYREAIELAYCGAKVIHPKTIKPLQNKGIPLMVKPFHLPSGQGSVISATEEYIPYPPIVILKEQQMLLSLTPRDYSFVIEDALSRMLATLYEHRVKMNTLETSAINFSLCVDDEAHFLPNAIKVLKRNFSVRYNRDLQLITVRHYNQRLIDELTAGKTILLEQRTRTTVRLVVSR